MTAAFLPSSARNIDCQASGPWSGDVASCLIVQYRDMQDVAPTCFGSNGDEEGQFLQPQYLTVDRSAVLERLSLAGAEVGLDVDGRTVVWYSRIRQGTPHGSGFHPAHRGAPGRTLDLLGDYSKVFTQAGAMARASLTHGSAGTERAGRPPRTKERHGETIVAVDRSSGDLLGWIGVFPERASPGASSSRGHRGACGPPRMRRRYRPDDRSPRIRSRPPGIPPAIRHQPAAGAVRGAVHEAVRHPLSLGRRAYVSRTAGHGPVFPASAISMIPCRVP